MQLECARCRYTADETYELDMPFSNSKPMESCDSGKCPECGAPGPDAPEADATAAVGIAV